MNLAGGVEELLFQDERKSAINPEVGCICHIAGTEKGKCVKSASQRKRSSEILWSLWGHDKSNRKP
jgi:hypothetical protein